MQCFFFFFFLPQEEAVNESLTIVRVNNARVLEMQLSPSVTLSQLAEVHF